MLACKLYQRFDSNHVRVVYKIGYDDVAGVSTASSFILSFSTKIITILSTNIPILILLMIHSYIFAPYHVQLLHNYRLIDWFIVFNATFSNISAISWRPVLVVEEAGVPEENHRIGASNWWTLSLAAVSPVVCNLQSRARTHAVLLIGLYELLGNPTT